MEPKNRGAALAELHRACSPSGIVASTVVRDNYRRIWARDSVISGLAAVAANDETGIDALCTSLDTLAANAASTGAIPSNVSADTGQASFGTLVGRTDAGAWFVIGAWNAISALDLPHDHPQARLWLQKAIAVEERYRVLEQNGRGLIYTPRGGCWADEYPIDGYTLTEQLLRLWALRCLAAWAPSELWISSAQKLTQLIETNYWLHSSSSNTAYHPTAFERAAAARCGMGGWVSSFGPDGYRFVFDGLANALATLLDVSSDHVDAEVVRVGEALRARQDSQLLPAFWPSITEKDPAYQHLQAMALYDFRNLPGHYHNGGGWPMVNGFWGLALVRTGRVEVAQAVLDAVERANRHAQKAPFPEYIAADGQAGGVSPCTWSAAAEVLLGSTLRSLGNHPDRQLPVFGTQIVE